MEDGKSSISAIVNTIQRANATITTYVSASAELQERYESVLSNLVARLPVDADREKWQVSKVKKLVQLSDSVLSEAIMLLSNIHGRTVNISEQKRLYEMLYLGVCPQDAHPIGK